LSHAFFWELWNRLESVLLEVFIESEGGGHCFLLHQCETGAIREAEILVTIFFKDIPSNVLDFGGDS